MTLPRLLTAAVFVCASLAFAQDQQVSLNAGAGSQPAVSAKSDLSTVAKSSEPWQFGQLETAADSARTPLERIAGDQLQIKTHKFLDGRRFRMNNREVIPDPDSDIALTGDVTCYTMRSYRVARDSKDSDSTHAAGYTTCQPTAQYRLKTTEMKTVTLESSH